MMHAEPYVTHQPKSNPTLMDSLQRVKDMLLEARELAQIVCEDVSGLVDRDADKKLEPIPAPNAEGLLGEAERLCVIARDLTRFIRNAGISLGCPRMSVEALNAEAPKLGRRL